MVRSDSSARAALNGEIRPRFLTLAEAAAMLSTPAETVRGWIWQGKLKAYRPGRAVLIRESDLLAYVEGREVNVIRAEKARRSGLKGRVA